MIENAPTFLDEYNDPERTHFDLDWIRAFTKPALLTMGGQSPPIYAPVLAKIVAALPRAELVTFPGAGHVPYASHPEAYVETVSAFIRKHEL